MVQGEKKWILYNSITQIEGRRLEVSISKGGLTTQCGSHIPKKKERKKGRTVLFHPLVYYEVKIP